jgi:hypothetical protein
MFASDYIKINIYMKRLILTIWTPIYEKIQADAQKKGITTQAAIRNILADYYEKTN